MVIKVGLISLGCQKNLVDSESMLGFLVAEGCELTGNKDEADLILINTCTFIKDARDETELNIKEFIQWKKDGPNRKLILAGCHVQREKAKVFTLWPEVDGVIGVGDIPGIKKLIVDLYKKNKSNISYIDQKFKSTEYDSPRILSTFSASSYIKIADGCNNNCSYCIIPQVRGGFLSRSVRAIVHEANDLAELGIRELNLIAQDIGAFGIDRKEKGLVRLVKKLIMIKNIEWIRLLYLYPDHITDDLIDLIASEPKICKYIDIPMQHVNDRILKLMNRRSSRQHLINLIDKLRERVPGIVIRSTFIVGFPQETESEFEELLKFLGEVKLDKVGFFSYSAEEGTKAAMLPGQVSSEEKERRLLAVQDLQSSIMDEINCRLVGTEQIILIDEPGKGRFFGQAPDIDGYVQLDELLAVGDLIKVRLTGFSGPDFKGEVIK